MLFSENKRIGGDQSIDTFEKNGTILPNRDFILVNKWGPEVNHSSIGLLINTKKDYVSFIDQLYQEGIIDKKQFSIETFDQSNGQIVIGNDLLMSNTFYYKKAFDISALEKKKYITPHLITIRLVFNNKQLNEERIIMKNIEVLMDEAFGLV